MLFCLAKTDDVRLIASLRVGHVHDDAFKPAEQVDPLLIVGFPGDGRSPLTVLLKEWLGVTLPFAEPV
jgi:hypothetical protein